MQLCRILNFYGLKQNLQAKGKGHGKQTRGRSLKQLYFDFVWIIFDFYIYLDNLLVNHPPNTTILYIF